MACPDCERVRADERQKVKDEMPVNENPLREASIQARESLSLLIERVQKPAQQQEPSGWQPIETAPKEADLLLLLDADTNEVRAGFWDDLIEDRETWVATETNGITAGRMAPTHWQPLPAPPSGGPKRTAAAPLCLLSDCREMRERAEAAEAANRILLARAERTEVAEAASARAFEAGWDQRNQWRPGRPRKSEAAAIWAAAVYLVAEGRQP